MQRKITNTLSHAEFKSPTIEMTYDTLKESHCYITGQGVKIFRQKFIHQAKLLYQDVGKRHSIWVRQKKYKKNLLKMYKGEIRKRKC